jgi:succinyl-CoA synthetase beta subunit
MGWRIDDVAQKPVLMFSLQGGVEIESHADSVTQWPVDPLKRLEPHELIPFFVGADVAGKMLGPLSRFASDLYRVFRAEDALLLEINPLAATPQGGLVALDCKMTVDEAALVRHTYWRDCASYELRHSGMTAAEAAGADAGVTYVELSGDIALLSSGAGLGMALVDLLADAGFKAANFCDIIGGSGISAFTSIADLVFDRAERPDVRAIAAFFTLSATSLKPAVGALIDVIKRRPPSKPLVIGFAATGAAVRDMSVAEAREEFARFGYPCVTDPADLIDALRAKLS